MSTYSSKFGWGGRFRTLECGSQSPMPYHLATPQYRELKKIWLGWQDLNLRMRESKSLALPLGDTPKSKILWGGRWVSNPRPQDPQSCALTNCATSTINFGVPWGIRTPDPRLRRAMLYPAELKAHTSNLSKKIWSGWWESNSRNQLGRLTLYHWATPA